MSPAVNLAEILERLEPALMSMLTSGAEAQTREMVVVERLCAYGRIAVVGDNMMESALSGIAERAPMIAGLMMVPDGRREVAFSESIRLVGELRARLDRLRHERAA